MSKHNYTNPAFCQGSEFYPTPSADQSNAHSASAVEAIYNRSLNLNYSSSSSSHRFASRNPRDGPLRIQRSMSTRSFGAPTTATRRTAPAAPAHFNRQQMPPKQQQQREQQQQQQVRLTGNKRPAGTSNSPSDAFETRSTCGRYALVPVEDLPAAVTHSRYAIVPGPALGGAKRYARSQENLDSYGASERDEEQFSFNEEPHSFHGQNAEQFTSLPPTFEAQQRPEPAPPIAPKIKHAFSSDFGSKTFLIVDKNSNQRYQMVPTAEDEELVDDNHEIIQMHNGRAHRYAVIPTEDDHDPEDEEEEETCLSNPDLNESQHYLMSHHGTTRTPLPRTSTPQKSSASMANLASYPSTPLKNPAATKMLHELLSTPRKTPLPRLSAQTTPSNGDQQMAAQREHRRLPYHRSQQQLYAPANEVRTMERAAHSLHYESVKSVLPLPSAQHDRTMAVITPRVTHSKVYPQLEEEEEDCSSIHGQKANGTLEHPQKVASAAVTLAVVSLMLVIGSVMNSALIIYMIAHFGRAFYLQYSLAAAFCGVGLGFLGFRSRRCDWLPNRSYTSGYILVTTFCLLKCCGLVVILKLGQYPGLPVHDMVTGVILGLSTFTMFFMGLGVIGSLWCYRPPPDNRVNVV